MYLNCLFKFQAEVLKDAETLVQFEGVFVFTEEIDQSVPLHAELQLAMLQVHEGLSRGLQRNKHVSEKKFIFSTLFIEALGEEMS